MCMSIVTLESLIYHTNKFSCISQAYWPKNYYFKHFGSTMAALCHEEDFYWKFFGMVRVKNFPENL